MDEFERRVKEKGQEAHDMALANGMSPEQADELRHQTEEWVREHEGPVWKRLEAEARERERIAKALHERGRHYYGTNREPDDSVH